MSVGGSPPLTPLHFWLPTRETSFVLMDLATHTPGGLQAPTLGDTSFIAALKGRRPELNTGPTDKRRCYYCGREGYLRECCPTPLQDCLRQQVRPGSPCFPLTPSRARPTPHQIPAPGRKQARFEEAANNLPVVTKSYGRRQVTTIEEDPGPSRVEEDPLADVNLATLDEATVAALYEEFQDIPEDGPDFLE